MDWYDNLPDDQKSFAYSVNFDLVKSKEDFLKQIETIKKDADIAKITQEAESLEIDLNTFETYADILADNNKELADNELLSKKVALAQMRLNKGLTTLVDSWDDISKALSKAERSSVEYAEAVGQLKKSFEEMFGYKPSTDFIESHLEEI
jgi:hypothetical protein